jgi:DNA repair protein RadC
MEPQTKYLDLPRQKLLQHGIQSLSDSELLSLLLGTGTKNQPVVTLAQEVLHHANGIYDLGRLSLLELKKVKGIGEAKAMAIIAAMELGRRRDQSSVPKRIMITTSQDAYQFFSHLSDLPHEEFWILFLNRSNKVIGQKRISEGGISGTVVDSRILFKLALECLASSVILCHNHPSGNTKPSDADIKLTRRLRDAGSILDVGVVDHIIIGDKNYFSFADEGMV